MVKLDDAARHDAAAQAATPTDGAAAGACGFANPDALTEGVAPVLGNDGGHASATAGCRSDRNVEAGHGETQPSTTECGETASDAAEPGGGTSGVTGPGAGASGVTGPGAGASGVTGPGAGASGVTGPDEAASDATEPGAGASDAEAAGVSEPGWGVSYGFDHDVELPGDAAIAEQAGAEPGWGAAGAAGESREVGPFFDALDAADAAVDALQALLADRSVPVADLAAATVRLHQLTCRVQAAHLAALGQTVAANALPEGSPTANAWLGVSHRMDSSRASKARNDAAWLAEHPKVAEALAAGVISVDHVTVMRTVSQANKIRRAAFADFETAAIAAAILTDPSGLRQIMNLWATTVDPDSADDDADKNYERRKLFVDQVGDRCYINGELPAEMGALLAGALNAFMDELRDAYTNGDGIRVPASARRADALIALVNAAIAYAATANNNAAATAGAGSNGPSGSNAADAADGSSINDAQLTLDTIDTDETDEADETGASAADADPTSDDDADRGSSVDANPANADDAPSDDNQHDTTNEDAAPNSDDAQDDTSYDAAATRTSGDDPNQDGPDTSDPSDPVGPNDPSDPVGPNDPNDPVDPSNPSGPSDPFGPGGSGAVITLPPTAVTRAQVTVTVPITTLHTCPSCRRDDDPAAALACILTGHNTNHNSTGNGTGADASTGAECNGGASNGSTGGCPTTDAHLGSDARDTIGAALATGATWAVGNGPGTGTLAPALARYASCDGEITRLVVAPASRPLDLGRTRRVVPLSLRRALEIRDRGCIIPGCDRPAGWCHAHHITHWADGGETDLSNLALICQHHHTELHLGHWHIDMNNGTPKATHIPPHQRARYRRNQRTAQSNRPATTPRRT